jgi:glycosyltransferase involved in cell wall biosynthesis
MTVPVVLAPTSQGHRGTQMEIIIVAGGIPFGPETLKHRSLGGSETAALMVAKALKQRGHTVTLFCPLPPQGAPDHHPDGMIADDGVRYIDIQKYPTYISHSECDLLVVSRDARWAHLPHQAKSCVLWLHDLAEHHFSGPIIQSCGWTFNEVWCVSEFHRKQVHSVTGYPLDRIRVTRNGIVPVPEVIPTPKITRQLLFASRPERGLEHLVKPGGIMSRLPEFTLKFCMYANVPEHMRDYYGQLHAWAKELPNCEFVGFLKQAEMRQLVADSWLYVYPSDFEETSCILARECAEQKTPLLGFAVGALPETVGSCGVLLTPDLAPKIGEVNEESYDAFVHEVRCLEEIPEQYERIQAQCERRTDLYWGGVAEQWEEFYNDIVLRQQKNTYSLLHSLIEVSDVVPAFEVAARYQGDDPFVLEYIKQMRAFYPFLTGEKSLKQHYDDYYREVEKPKNNLPYHDMRTSARYVYLREELAKLPPGSKVLDYACGEGSVVITLAQDLPHLEFYGCDHADDEIEALERNKADKNVPNIKRFFVGSTEVWPAELEEIKFDAAMANEVLEHVEKPWELLTFVESKVKLGGRVLLTVPYGPWETIGLRQYPEQFHWRAHIWHIDKWMLREMLGEKKNPIMLKGQNGHRQEDRMALGNTFFAYDADHVPIPFVDPVVKAHRSPARQTVGLAVISMNNEDTIMHMLNSVGKEIDVLQVALGPSDDATEAAIHHWSRRHPWVQVRIVNVPKIELEKFGFDDARNASVEGLPTDWVLWLDTDEYVSGQGLRVFTRDNAYDSYAIRQHHFSTEPVGAPAQIDKPARLFRNNGTFKFFGKVHEHAEKGFNGGPGFAFEIPNIDIGHVGYKNEEVRKHRFMRNFPLLVWDRQVYPERKLGYYLWLRDQIHRMRFIASNGDLNTARALAEEAIKFYTDNREAMRSFGQGTMLALAYYAEAMNFLGRGLPIKCDLAIQMRPDQQPSIATFSGVIDEPETLTQIITEALKGPLEQRKSKYWG